MNSNYISGRSLSVLFLLVAVSLLASCVRRETVCECRNYQAHNGATQYNVLLARNIKYDDALVECAKAQKAGNGKFDTCLVKIIK